MSKNKLKAINFPEANVQLGKSQDEYTTLPAFHDEEKNSFTFGFQLSREQVLDISRTGEVWLQQLIPEVEGFPYKRLFQPISIGTRKEEFVVATVLALKKGKETILDYVKKHNGIIFYDEGDAFKFNLEALKTGKIISFKFRQGSLVNIETGLSLDYSDAYFYNDYIHTFINKCFSV